MSSKSKNIAIYSIIAVVVIVVVVVVLAVVLTKKSSSDTPVSTMTTSSNNPTTTSFGSGNMNAKSTLNYSSDMLDKYDTFIEQGYPNIQTQIKMIKSMRDALQSYMNSPNRTTSSIMMANIPSEMIEHSAHYLEIYDLVIKIGSLVPSNRKPNVQEKAQILQYMKQAMAIEEQLPTPMWNKIKDKGNSLDKSQIMTESSQLIQQLQQLQLQSDGLQNQLKSITDNIMGNPKFESLVQKQQQEFLKLSKQQMDQPNSFKLENKIKHLQEKITLYMQHLNELRLQPQTTQSMK